MKKSFKDMDNPALQFISSAQQEEPTPAAPAAEKEEIRYKPNPQYIEVKSRRVQLVFQPSLYKRVKKAAKAAGLSVNEYVHQILDRETKGV